MSEVIIIVESGADARTATKLAERVLLEKIDWLEEDNLQYFFDWCGLEAGTEYSCWKDINEIVKSLKSSGLKLPRYLGHHSEGVPLEEDGSASIKVLKLVSFLQRKRRREIKAVLFIRDLDNKPERKEGLEQARSQNKQRQPQLEIIIGTANPKREAWVLNGFIPSNQREEQILGEIKTKLSFDPCIEAHRLRSTSQEESDRIRNPKVVVEQLTGNDMERERLCWEETSLAILRERGVNTGLLEYICEVEQYLTLIL